MSMTVTLFIVLAVVLVLLLAWAVRPPKKTLLAVDDVFDALAEKRHYARLPQILQSLRHEDTDYLYTRGHDHLAGRIRRERKQIALRYLNYLEGEYQLLLEASRILARIAPEISRWTNLRASGGTCDSYCFAIICAGGCGLDCNRGASLGSSPIWKAI
jgi:hypothetical protein